MPENASKGGANMTTSTLDQRVTALERRLTTPTYYKLDEVATIAGVTTRTVYTWINKRGLREVVIDGVKRIKNSDLEEFMTAHTV